MNIPNIPTDASYKFFAFLGLLLIGYTVYDKIEYYKKEDERLATGSEYFGLRELYYHKVRQIRCLMKIKFKDDKHIAPIFNDSTKDNIDTSRLMYMLAVELEGIYDTRQSSIDRRLHMLHQQLYEIEDKIHSGLYYKERFNDIKTVPPMDFFIPASIMFLASFFFWVLNEVKHRKYFYEEVETKISNLKLQNEKLRSEIEVTKTNPEEHPSFSGDNNV